MISRVAPAALVLALTAAMTSGCFAQPEPEEKPLFETEAEAFAAAEETYRAYVDALNQVDLSDPETFEDVYTWTTGEANAGERKSLSSMHADGWTVDGATEVISIYPLVYSPRSEPTVELGTCTDVSAIDVRDPDGSSVVSQDRPDTQSSTVQLVSSATSPTGLLISVIEGSDVSC
ncbi:hypothetical protein ABZ477_16870 [Microbacterium sp. NPDC019599]|uniref:hypothetical protein n=1 Tax=Microbacterium sp. NPDC019599 TaxID=3154690 RepID=UPI0033E5DEBF